MPGGLGGVRGSGLGPGVPGGSLGSGVAPGVGYGLGAGSIPGGTGVRGGPTGAGGNCMFEMASAEQFSWFRCT